MLLITVSVYWPTTTDNTDIYLFTHLCDVFYGDNRPITDPVSGQKDGTCQSKRYDISYDDAGDRDYMRC